MKQKKLLLRVILMATVMAGLSGVSGCLLKSDDDDDDGGGTASCTDLTGSWLLTSWTCDGTPTDLATLGVQATRAFTSASSGTQTIKFFVPTNQTALWYSRTNGLSATYGTGTVTLTDAAPAESCSTDSVPNANWGPVTTGVGSETCTHDTSAPGSPGTNIFTCSTSGTTFTMTLTPTGTYGPCNAGQVSIETFSKQ